MRADTARHVTPANDADPRFWVASDSVATSPVGDDLAVFAMDSDTYFTLNDSGARIWSMLDRPRTADEIAQTLATEFDRPQHECLDDVQALLHELQANDLVRETGAPDAT